MHFHRENASSKTCKLAFCKDFYIFFQDVDEVLVMLHYLSLFPCKGRRDDVFQMIKLILC